MRLAAEHKMLWAALRNVNAARQKEFRDGTGKTDCQRRICGSGDGFERQTHERRCESRLRQRGERASAWGLHLAELGRRLLRPYMEAASAQHGSFCFTRANSCRDR